jgi:hypothetical protein
MASGPQNSAREQAFAGAVSPGRRRHPFRSMALARRFGAPQELRIELGFLLLSKT